MDLNDLRVFESVGSLLSFFAAGRALGMPKSSASRGVGRLGAALGARLCRRTTWDVVLTQRGAALQERCRSRDGAGGTCSGRLVARPGVCDNAHAMDALLIDRIYESAFVPELWPGALDGLAAMADARGGVLLAVDGDTSIPRWTASENLREYVAAFVAGGWLTQGRRLAVAATHAGFLAEQSTDEALGEQPMYRDFLRPLGLGWSAGSALPMPTGDMILISVERDHARGRMEPQILRQLDTVRPHLARSALLSARLQMERARAVSETLGALGLPALVFEPTGAVLAANGLIEGLGDHIRWRAHDRVSLKDPGADALFAQAVATLDVANAPPARSFAVRGAEATAALVAHVIPVRGAARDLFARCAGVLVLTPVTVADAPPVELVRSLFDLTAAEARVARALAAGDSVGDIAQAGGVSVNTVRAQVRGVLEKTGCRRQAEVVALLGGIAVTAGSPSPLKG